MGDDHLPHYADGTLKIEGRIQCYYHFCHHHNHHHYSHGCYIVEVPLEPAPDPVEEERKKYERHVYVHDMLPFILVMRTLIDKVRLDHSDHTKLSWSSCNVV